MSTSPPNRLSGGEDEDLADTAGMPHPDAGTEWMFRPPSGIPPEAERYLISLENRPSGEAPSYAEAPGYALPGRITSNQQFHIYSVGRRASRAQDAGYRRPFDFERAHGIFFRVRFELLPIPDHAMGVAYLNYHDRTWLFGRRVGNFHVQFRSAHPPYHMDAPRRLSDFCNEALSRVGTYRPNKSRWYYFCWNRAHHGENGELLM